MVAVFRLKPVFIWLSQKPKRNSKNHVLIYDLADLDAFNSNKVDIHAYYSKTGKLIGYATRKSLRKLNLVSKAAHVFVFNKKGELFMQRRAPTKDIYPNLIAPSASGHIDLNESPKEAAIRELKEELNITGQPNFLGKIKCFTNKLNEFLEVFIIITNASIEINKDEISEGFFIPFTKIYEKPLFLEYIPAMQKELLKFKPTIIKELKKQIPKGCLNEKKIN